ncbi:hypothetical protein [Methanorbis rubei]|uniref:PGF-CTERM sorting domain-containing protein n=1 Tax=Methanorbis rubei TaxID=3028300 RepID=A0AAE4ME92_9EURY|nr:hypothetical protein [Methanocorpusculaceae archaeon Cs1]
MLIRTAAAEDTWIRINPIQQPAIDEPYIITGSTNIPSDTAIVLKIHRYDGTLPTSEQKDIQNLPVAFTTTMVVDGDASIRSWSVEGPKPESLPAGNYDYVAAASLMYADDELLAVEYLPKPNIWAAIYPVFDRTVGDAVRISGTTNIPEGGTVLIEVSHVDGQTSAFQKNVIVSSGDNGTNTWTVVVDTAGFSPGMHTVTIPDVMHQQGPGFMLNPFVNVSPWWITFDPIYDQSIEEPLVLSGATNLAAGTTLDVVIKSASLLVTGTDYPKAFVGTAVVQKGDAGINFWSSSAEIQPKYADQYEVTVTDAETKARVFDYVNLDSFAGAPLDEYWITMNEVRTSGANESYVISGSTTVPLGTTVVVDLYRIDTTVSTVPDDVSSLPKTDSISTIVLKGENGVNHWVAVSSLRSEDLLKKNIRSIAVAYPREFSQVSPVSRMVQSTGDWTTVDQVPGGVIGDLITISGKTSLAPGEWITFEVYEVPWAAKPDQKPKEPVFSKEVMIGKGSLWSVELDTSNLRIGKYTIVADDASYLSGPVFSLGTAAKYLWIVVDPIPLLRQGDNFTLSGRTGLDAGLHLLIEILPKYIVEREQAHDSRSYSTSSGMYQVVMVERGEDGENIWSVPVSTEKWKADTYYLKISALEVDLTQRGVFELYPRGYVQQTATESPEKTQTPGFACIATMLVVAAAVMLARK